MLKHLIWTNDPYEVDETLTDEEIEENLDDERMNLDINVGGPILVIGDLGLWNGRRMGFKIIRSGNVADCLVCDNDYVTWFVDEEGEFRCDSAHHDGTNHYRYRTWKSRTSSRQKERLLNDLYRGTATEEEIQAATKRVGPYICQVYGWKIGRRVKKGGDSVAE
jgi:hypothetical protein